MRIQNECERPSEGIQNPPFLSEEGFIAESSELAFLLCLVGLFARSHPCSSVAVLVPTSLRGRGRNGAVCPLATELRPCPRGTVAPWMENLWLVQMSFLLTR